VIGMPWVDGLRVGITVCQRHQQLGERYRVRAERLADALHSQVSDTCKSRQQQPDQQPEQQPEQQQQQWICYQQQDRWMDEEGGVNVVSE
jgi:hypothetical protein